MATLKTDLAYTEMEGFYTEFEKPGYQTNQAWGTALLVMPSAMFLLCALTLFFGQGTSIARSNATPDGNTIAIEQAHQARIGDTHSH